jgi:hypothetical protein
MKIQLIGKSYHFRLKQIYCIESTKKPSCIFLLKINSFQQKNMKNTIQQIMNIFLCVLRFKPARQVPEIILNEYSRNTENALRNHKAFYKVFYKHFFSVVFKTVFGMFLAHLVCLKSLK